MLIVTGTQRSGTSAAAKLFMEEGYDLGTTWWDEIAQGGLENPTVCAFYREFLGDLSFPFDDFKYSEEDVKWEAQLLAKFMNLHTQHKVIKFSYLGMNPVFVNIWKKYRPPILGDKFLFMRRDTAAVVESKSRVRERFEHDSVLLQQPPDVLRWASLMSLGILKQFYPVSAMPFDNLINNYCINDYLEPLGSDVPRISEEVWERVIDPELIHV